MMKVLISKKKLEKKKKIMNTFYKPHGVKNFFPATNGAGPLRVPKFIDEDEEEEEEEEESDESSDSDGKYIIIKIAVKRKHEEEDDDDDDDDDDDEDEEEDESDFLPKIPPITKRIKDELGNHEIVQKLREIQSPSTLVRKCISACEETIHIDKYQKDSKKSKETAKEYSSLIRERHSTSDKMYFKSLSSEKQQELLESLREIQSHSSSEEPYMITLLRSKSIPVAVKSIALKKIHSLTRMDPSMSEYFKVKNWIDGFMRIPFNIYCILPVHISDGVETCHEFIMKSKKILDDAVFGLNDAKMQVIQLLGQLVANPDSVGSAIAIQGPMGTGKTSLVKEGISKILRRPFAFIALGGATDGSFLDGHSYTYEGSMWGRIVQTCIDCKCMNPVFYFDELDKISDTPKGEEIVGILTHLTDTSQNSGFHDEYFAGIDFDLSKCLFIFSYNDESKVNPILKDRMFKIQTGSYSKREKTIIASTHLIPKICKEIHFQLEDIIFSDEIIEYIIDNCCERESGVRNLKRCIENIYTKINLYRLTLPGTQLFQNSSAAVITFPLILNREIISKLIKSHSISASSSMYV